MFNLEEKIAEWRQQMLAAGIQAPVPLEELEIHLREEIERQTKSGWNARRAFESAVLKTGQGGLLKEEFQKVRPLKLNRIVSVVVGIATCVVGCFGAWTLAVQSRGLGQLPNEAARLMGAFALASILAIALVVTGLILIFYGGSNVSWLPDERRKHV